MEYKYFCPDCNREVIYKTEKAYNKAIDTNKLCRVCIEKIKNLNTKYVRNCPVCNKEINYNYKSDYSKAINKNTLCKSCCNNSGRFKIGHKLNDVYNNSENNIDSLLNETLESFYWLGFIIADGSFYDNTFELNISKKDTEHLELFKQFLNSGKIIEKPSTNSVRLLIHDRHSVQKVIKKFGFIENKTYNPLNFDTFFKIYNNNLILSLLIGIIDGDGHISRNSAANARSITITAHENWENFYKNLFDNLNIEVYINRVKDTNCITIGMYKRKLLLTIYNFIINNNIPHLKRKWDIIKETIKNE